ncbi:circadian clock KaiB family protein [Neorhizobium sp. DT-125]|uniref:circadian clock KaiB family protein n=1 Tax=Neorhizobium sp. DT-125 TaxID=3396163 RepID=UPI003F1ADE52
MSIEDVSGPASRPDLWLYIAGETPGALRALESRMLLIEAMGGALDIEIVDILDRPEEAEHAGILATPTLSDASQPPRRLIGDIGDVAQVLDFFGYRKKEAIP